MAPVLRDKERCRKSEIWLEGKVRLSVVRNSLNVTRLRRETVSVLTLQTGAAPTCYNHTYR